MDFGEALRKVKEGLKVHREGWILPGTYIILYNPEGADGFSKPFLVQWNHFDSMTPWTPTSVDLLSEDWEIVDSAQVD